MFATLAVSLVSAMQQSEWAPFANNHNDWFDFKMDLNSDVYISNSGQSSFVNTVSYLEFNSYIELSIYTEFFSWYRSTLTSRFVLLKIVPLGFETASLNAFRYLEILTTEVSIQHQEKSCGTSFLDPIVTKEPLDFECYYNDKTYSPPYMIAIFDY